MAQAMLKCPDCGQEIIQDHGSKQKLRSNILVWEKGGCIAKCRCGADVQVPVTLDVERLRRQKAKRLVHVVLKP